MIFDGRRLLKALIFPLRERVSLKKFVDQNSSRLLAKRKKRFKKFFFQASEASKGTENLETQVTRKLGFCKSAHRFRPMLSSEPPPNSAPHSDPFSYRIETQTARASGSNGVRRLPKALSSFSHLQDTLRQADPDAHYCRERAKPVTRPRVCAPNPPSRKYPKRGLRAPCQYTFYNDRRSP